jgi:hypothetical protein
LGNRSGVLFEAVSCWFRNAVSATGSTAVVVASFARGFDTAATAVLIKGQQFIAPAGGGRLVNRVCRATAMLFANSLVDAVCSFGAAAAACILQQLCPLSTTTVSLDIAATGSLAFVA